MFALRPYQHEAVEAVLRELAGHRSTLIVLPTGTGKTIVFAAVAHRWRATGGRVLVLAHREELIDQARDKITRATPLTVGIEMADARAGDELFGVSTDVVVGSVQTLSRPSRREVYQPDAFGLIVIDEAHHAPAQSYRSILDYFAPAKVLGVTATPDRADEIGMHNVFESVAFVYEIRDAIDEHYLAPIKQRAVEVEGLDLSRVRTTAGDLNEGDLEAILADEEMLHKVVSPTVEQAGTRPTLMFATTVAHAKSLAEVINRPRPGCAVAMDGTMDRKTRHDLLVSFAAGEFQFLVNCALFTEGFDSPSIACVAVARPTKSRALYAQMIGRGTRLHPGKEDLLVLDYVGNAGRHKLVSAADILGGKEAPEVVERAKELLAGGGEQPVHEAIDQARAQIAEEKRRAKLVAAAKYKSVEIDPFDVLGVTAPQTDYARRAPSEKQLAALARFKVPIDPAKITRGEASALLDKLIGRARAGMCTFKQANALAKRGLRSDVTFDQARMILDQLAMAQWRVPPWIRDQFGIRSTEAA